MREDFQKSENAPHLTCKLAESGPFFCAWPDHDFDWSRTGKRLSNRRFLGPTVLLC
jgi:hypothetical protein